jgi:flagellar basal-body rod modification protein FlgD
MSTNVWPNYAKDNTSTAKQTGDKSLGKDDFLKILVEQLKNQDPSQPLADKDFIAQMATFSSVEQQVSMVNEMKLMRQSMGIGSSLLGKNVTWTDTNASTNVSVTKNGVVDSITFKDGVQYANVKGDEFPLDRIVKITNVEGS